MDLEVEQVFLAAAPVRPLRGLRKIVSTANSVGISIMATYKDTESPIVICRVPATHRRLVEEVLAVVMNINVHDGLVRADVRALRDLERAHGERALSEEEELGNVYGELERRVRMVRITSVAAIRIRRGPRRLFGARSWMCRDQHVVPREALLSVR